MRLRFRNTLPTCLPNILLNTMLCGFFCCISLFVKATAPADSLAEFYTHKDIPDSLNQAVLEALTYYPEFKSLPITFKYTDQISTALMEAQPEFSTVLKPKKFRAYYVYMTPALIIKGEVTPLHKLPHDVLLGWLVHELGHIKDYESRNGIQMVWFGLAYSLSANYKIKAERQADLYAIQKNGGPYIIATKNFILNSADLPEFYKRKIRNLYMSPEEVAQIIEKELELEDVEEYNEEKKESIK